MRIGYSFWGFLGAGITDTPDGGRSHRRVLVDGLKSKGYDVTFLQRNRDYTDVHCDLSQYYVWDSGFPDIDVLFLEWRWPIPGRNTTKCGTSGHTCDLHRQEDLLKYYTFSHKVRTIIWDKDLMLPADDPLREDRAVVVCEAATYPSPNAVSLLFPVEDATLDSASPVSLAAAERPMPLAYIGNQYDRDRAFGKYFAPAATEFEHVVAGKWTRTTSWPHIRFAGRIPFGEVKLLYRTTVATTMLLPDRYAASGQMTQRIFEAVLEGCLPLAPTSIKGAERFVPEALLVRDGRDVAERLKWLLAIRGRSTHVELIAGCLSKLDLFRVSRQLEVLDYVIQRKALIS